MKFTYKLKSIKTSNIEFISSFFTMFYTHSSLFVFALKHDNPNGKQKKRKT